MAPSFPGKAIKIVFYSMQKKINPTLSLRFSLAPVKRLNICNTGKLRKLIKPKAFVHTSALAHELHNVPQEGKRLLLWEPVFMGAQFSVNLKLLCGCVCLLVAQSRPTLRSQGLLCPWNSPGKHTQGWVAIPFSKKLL